MATSLESSELIHDGDTFLIFKGVHRHRHADGELKKDVAIKACKRGRSDAVTSMNNEYNILRLKRMAECNSVRTVVDKEDDFDPHDGTGPTRAVLYEWVEGETLSNWLKEKNKEMALAILEDEANTRNGCDDTRGVSAESAIVLDKVKLAHALASAVADIHDAGVIHNDLRDASNIIVSPSGDACTMIDFAYADQSHSLEACDEGERVNDDLPQMAELLKMTFSLGGEGKDAAMFSFHSSCKRLSYGEITGDFSRTFIEKKGAILANGGGRGISRGMTSVYNFGSSRESACDDTNSTSSYEDTASSHSSLNDVGVASSGHVSFGLKSISSLDPVQEEFQNDALFPSNLPQSIRRLLADIEDHGRGNRETAYNTAREVASDLGEMLADPAIFISDPKSEHIRKTIFQRPPRKLYGREKQLALLMAATNRLLDAKRKSEGTTEVMLVMGQSGTGKSSLLRQVKSMVTQCVFCTAKFDQLKSTEPYSAISQIITQLVDYILAEDEESIAEVKKSIMDAVGSNGKVLCDTFPSLIDLLGEQPDVPNLKGIEAQNRFRYIAMCFARAICRPSRPLIIVLDDIQWADFPSLDLIRTLVMDDSNKHLLFIGCYRDDEMDSLHQTSMLIEDMKRHGVPVSSIELANMDVKHVNSFVSERLRLPRRYTRPLADVVHRKSLGNAFFATQFISALADDGLLVYSPTDMRWVWDVIGADAKTISDDVCTVMAQKIESLSTDAQVVLKKACCVGATFDMSIIQELLVNVNETKVEKQLNKLSKQGFIIKKMRRNSLSLRREDLQFRFSHDRIQQAAYNLVPDEEKSDLHLQIGRFFQRELDQVAGAPPALIFRATDHRNRGKMVDQKDQIDLAKLNARAGDEAYAACAYGPALTYVQKGLELLGDENTRWNDHYELTLHLSNLYAELNYCIGDFEGSKTILDTVRGRARSFDDIFHAETCNIKSLMLIGDLNTALSGSLGVLQKLDEPLPRSPNIPNILIQLLKTKRSLRRKSDRDLLAIPPMTDERISKVMVYNGVLGSVTYILGSDYFPIVIFQSCQLILRYGMHDIGSFAVAAYGVMLLAILKDVSGAYRFGHLGLSLTKKDMLPKTHTLVYGFINHWHSSLLLTLDPLLNVYQVGLEVGDIEFAWYGLTIHSIHRFYCGQTLSSLIEQQRTCLRELAKAKKNTASDLVLPTYQAALNLAGFSEDPSLLNGDACEESEILKRSAATTNALLEYYYRMNAACVAYLFGEYELASEHSRLIRDIEDKFPALYAINVQAFYDGLSSFALAKKTNRKGSRIRWRRRGRRMAKKFFRWAKDCPSNNSHKSLLLRAEDAAISGQKSKKKRERAKALFDAAVTTAKANGFINDEAIACERAALFFEEIGYEGLFTSYVTRSYKLYIQWGATAKAEQLVKAHPETFA